MKNILALFVFGLLISSSLNFGFADTQETNSRPQPPKFENGTPPGFNQNRGNFENGQQPPQMNSQNNGQFNGRRPKFKPDSQPGGKMEPKEWDN